MSLDLHAQRMRRLERDLHHTRFVAMCGLFLSGGLALTAFQRSGSPVVRTERLELETQQGLSRAILSVDSLEFAVTLVDEGGRPAGAILLSEEPRVAVVTGRGREVAGLGAPKVHPLTE